MADEKRKDGIIQHSNTVLEHISNLYQNDQFSDVTLKVDNQSIRAHKVILASRSEYFSALLFGGLKETHSSEIEISLDTPIAAFQNILKYLYTGKLDIGQEPENQILDLYLLVDIYGVSELQTSLFSFITTHMINIENVIDVFNFAAKWNFENLKEECFSFLDKNVCKLINGESLNKLAACHFDEFFSRKSAQICEKDKFRVAKGWVTANKTASDLDRDIVLKTINLNQIAINDLLKIVRPTKLFGSEKILDAIENRKVEEDEHVKSQITVMETKIQQSKEEASKRSQESIAKDRKIQQLEELAKKKTLEATALEKRIWQLKEGDQATPYSTFNYSKYPYLFK